MTSYYIGYQIPYNFSTSTEYILVGTAGDFVYIDNNGALASAGKYLNVRDGYLTIGGALRIVELNEAPDTPIDGYGYLYVDSSGALHFKNDEGLDIALAAAGDSVTIGNIGAGTLAELNTAISDATLDDAGDPRDPNSHADSHVLDGTDELDGYNLAIDYTPTNYTAPVNNIIGEHIAAIDAALSNPVTDLTIADEEQGSILYFDGSDWVQLAPGDDGYALVTHSTGANPTWSSVQAAAAPIDSVFGRTGAITAASDDYAASEIDNDSTVTGEQVSDALEYLDGYVASVADDVTAVSTMTVNGDLSGTLPNPTVTDLTIASEEQGSVLYFNGSNWVQLPPGEDGYVLTTHGADAPTWEKASGGTGTTGTPFTITTETENIPVELAMAISLPASPSEGDRFGVGLFVECLLSRTSFIDNYCQTFFVAARFEYMSGVWIYREISIGRPVMAGVVTYPPAADCTITGGKVNVARETVPLVFKSVNDTGGLFVCKGTYRQITRIDS